MLESGFASSDLLITPEDLVLELGRRIALLGVAHRSGNKLWTTEIKKYLKEIADGIVTQHPGMTLETIHTEPTQNMREFLLDIVWWCTRGPGKENQFLAMAVEVEWGSYGYPMHASVGDDFGKLTVIKSPLKLMVFCTDAIGRSEPRHEPMRKKILEHLDEYLTNYTHHLPGEHYVFLDTATVGNMKAWVRSVGPDRLLSVLRELPTQS